MMIEPLYPYDLTAEQEVHIRKLYDESIVIDLLFQGPVGSYSFAEGFEEETKAEAEKRFPGDEMRQVDFTQSRINAGLTDKGGEFEQLYKDCWYDSGITAGNRQLGGNTPEELYKSMISIQREFDNKPWLIKATSAADIEYAKQNNLKAGLITSQDCEFFLRDLSLLDVAYDFGLRSLGFTYNNHNLVGSGCMEPNNAGLSKLGIRLVEACNKKGVIIDTAHSGKQTTLDMCKYSDKPVIASHTGVENVFMHNRCKSDEEILAMAKTGGVIGIFAMPWFINADYNNSTVDHVIDHIDYVVKLVGIDHVGIGTDWPMPQTLWSSIIFKKYVAPSIGFAPGDGPSIEWIHGLKDYRSFINIARGLAARGYADDDIKKVLGGNWLRVYREICG